VEPKSGLALSASRRRPIGNTRTLVQTEPARDPAPLRESSNLSKLFLLSVIIATIVIPTRMAREKNARKGFKKAMVHMAIFNVFYLFVLLFIYGRL
jgi:hypothetical protein